MSELRTKSVWLRFAVFLLLIVLPVACVMLVPREGWDERRGPVVPHDTFPADCSLCHEGGNWTSIRADFKFDHGKETGYELLGAHKKASCLLCHNDIGPIQKFSKQGCAGCHEDYHRGKLGKDCDSCHDQSIWRPKDSISQHEMTRFPLVGAHAAAACFRCHPGAQTGNFFGATTECQDCHQADFQKAKNPDHIAQGWTDQCQRCHLPMNWQKARFHHPDSFPLTGAHAGARCTDCHSPTNFKGLSTQCSSCHTPEYNASNNPSHMAAGLGTDCDSCHNTSTWRPSSWQHTTSFPLTLGHSGRRCLDCHTGNVYSGTSTACSSCHLDDYQATTNPNHTAAFFPTDCTICHNTATWRPANFKHSSSFPLTGGHAKQCGACHSGGTFKGLSTACVSCHLTDYQNTTNPNHQGAGYSTDCTLCHKNNVTWKGAVFNHRFPLTKNHNLACTECHKNQANYKDVTCIACHEHRQSKMNDVHKKVNGYSWTSAACISCHPNGRK